jgi:hypothetical protein
MDQPLHYDKCRVFPVSLPVTDGTSLLRWEVQDPVGLLLRCRSYRLLREPKHKPRGSSGDDHLI